MIVFNEEELFNSYKEIVETCVNDGYALPVMVRDYNVPYEYKFSVVEKQRLYDEMSDDAKLTLGAMIKNRRQTELSILRNTNKKYRTVNDFYTEEVLSFIEKYPFYDKIILGEK